MKLNPKDKETWPEPMKDIQLFVQGTNYRCWRHPAKETLIREDGFSKRGPIHWDIKSLTNVEWFYCDSNGYIPISQGFPKYNELTLVKTKFRYLMVKRTNHDSPVYSDYRYKVVSFDEDLILTNYDIICWIPLPKSSLK